MKTNLKVREINNNLRQFPQAIKEEEACLSAALLGAADEVLNGLDDDDPYLSRSQVILKAIRELHHANEPIEALSTVIKLQDMGKLEVAGGATYVGRLVDEIPAPGMVSWAIDRVREAANKKRLLQVLNDIANSIYEGQDFKEIRKRFKKEIKNADRVSDVKVCFASYADLADYEPERWENIGKGLTGVPSGYVQIDLATGGFQPSDLIVIAARPGMGKTALLICFAENAARKGIPVLIFSLEMSKS